MIDVHEIKLSMRYPESRQEDITDAFTRGYTGAVEIGNKAIKKLEAENTKLRRERDFYKSQVEPVEEDRIRLGERWRKAESENAKLREELAKARDPQRIGGQADPSSFVYAIEQLREFRWQHATNDEDAIPYINNVAAAHERENAKLRELVRKWYPHMARRVGKDVLAQWGQLDVLRELGIEVGNA